MTLPVLKMPTVTLPGVVKSVRVVGRARGGVKAFALEREPPPEIQLWNAGANPTDYGVHYWTARSVAEVAQRYAERGNPLLIDVEHLGALAGEEITPTAGYARLEIRNGVPWLIFDWSSYGDNQIRTGQRRFLSPEYDTDPKTGEIIRLVRVSLVGDPGTHRARVLASADARTAKEQGMNPTLAAIMAILTSVTDPGAAIEAIKGFISASGDGASADAPPPDAPIDAAADDEAPGATDAPPGDKAAASTYASAAATGATVTTPAAAAKPAATVATGATGAAAAARGAAAAAAPTSPTDTTGAVAEVTRASAAAVRSINEAQRDLLIQTDGPRLEPAVLRWAASQPLEVVRGLLGAVPAAVDAPKRIAATRGATHGTEAGNGLAAADLETLRAGMGTIKATASAPFVTRAGLTLPTVTPTAYRRHKATAAATASAGKGDSK